jgi:hypothetical protein
MKVHWKMSYRITCCACDNRVEESLGGYSGETIPDASFPLLNGWERLPLGEYVCPKHSIEILIDGQAVKPSDVPDSAVTPAWREKRCYTHKRG